LGEIGEECPDDREDILDALETALKQRPTGLYR
jgi:hypothetical protein